MTKTCANFQNKSSFSVDLFVYLWSFNTLHQFAIVSLQKKVAKVINLYDCLTNCILQLPQIQNETIWKTAFWPRSWSFPKVETEWGQCESRENAGTFKHQRRLRAKLFEYNEVGIRYVDPLKVAPKLGSCRDKHAHHIFSSPFNKRSISELRKIHF